MILLSLSANYMLSEQPKKNDKVRHHSLLYIGEGVSTRFIPSLVSDDAGAVIYKLL